MASERTSVLGFIGFWVFVVGPIIAAVAGILSPANTALIMVLIILGIIAVSLNITSKEFTPFLLAIIALVVVGNLFAPLMILSIDKILGNILSYVAILVSPAAIPATVKALWSVGEPGE